MWKKIIFIAGIYGVLWNGLPSYGQIPEVADAFLEAAQRGDVETVQNILEIGVNVNMTDIGGQSALWLAASADHLEVVKLLLKHGADIEVRNSLMGWTPLHIAAYNGHADMVQALVSAGANVDAKDNTGRTPADYTSAFGQSSRILKKANKTTGASTPSTFSDPMDDLKWLWELMKEHTGLTILCVLGLIGGVVKELQSKNKSKKDS